MQYVAIALLAFLGAPLASVIGVQLPALALAPLRPSQLVATFVRFITPISIWTIAVMFGWLVKRWRPTASLAALAVGLASFVLAPLFFRVRGLPFDFALAGCEWNAVIALFFAGSFVTAADGVFAPLPSRLAYAACLGVLAIHLLLPRALWLAIGMRDVSLSASPGGSEVVLREFVSPQLIRFRARNDDVMAAAVSLRSKPCDPASRTRLRETTLGFLSELPLLADPPSFQPTTPAERRDRIMVGLNMPAGEVALEALRAGVLTQAELPQWARADITAKGTRIDADLTSPLRCP